MTTVNISRFSDVETFDDLLSYYGGLSESDGYQSNNSFLGMRLPLVIVALMQKSIGYISLRGCSRDYGVTEPSFVTLNRSSRRGLHLKS